MPSFINDHLPPDKSHERHGELKDLIADLGNHIDARLDRIEAILTSSADATEESDPQTSAPPAPPHD